MERTDEQSGAMEKITKTAGTVMSDQPHPFNKETRGRTIVLSVSLKTNGVTSPKSCELFTTSIGIYDLNTGNKVHVR